MQAKLRIAISLAVAAAASQAHATPAPVAAMHLERCGAVGALDRAGDAIVIGGEDLEGALRSAEAWQGRDDAWQARGRLGHARTAATATALADGTVVVIGGRDDAGDPIARAEQGPDDWTAAGALATARAGHTATLLPDGAHVLITGGRDRRGRPLASVELWQPDGRFARAPAMHAPRTDHTATLLDSGEVLVVGGLATDDQDAPLAEVERYDPKLRRWRATAALGHGRTAHTATRLADGRVLVVGGETGMLEPSASAEIYDPKTETWRDTGALAVARAGHAAVLLQDGRVMVIGGTTVACTHGGNACDRETVASVEIWDPARETWQVAAPLREARDHPVALVLADGRVLIAGGHAEAHQCRASAELRVP
jgi:hypothetical protein